MDTKGYQAVLQAHKGSNGQYFNAWSLTDTEDPIRAVLECKEKSYNGEILGEVQKVEYHWYK
jgi:hypothetical protein